MEKRDGVIFRKIAVGLVLVSSILFLSGCSNSDLEQNNAQLKRDNIRAKSYNMSLEARLEKTTLDNNNLKKELAKLRESNKGLNVTLAKSELEFSKKHKEELDTERKKLDSEREAFKQEQKTIEKEAYENADKNVSNKYNGGLIGISILFVFLLLVWLFRWRKNISLLSVKEQEINELIEKNHAQVEHEKKIQKTLLELENTINELKRKQKEGSKNQVVSKIEEYKARREQLLKSSGGIGHGD